MDRRLFAGQHLGGLSPNGGEGRRGATSMTIGDRRGHVQTLTSDLGDRPPVNRRRGCTQLFVDAVAEPDPLDERQTVAQHQTDLGAIAAVDRHRIRRIAATNRVGRNAVAGGVDAAFGKQIAQRPHPPFTGGDVGPEEASGERRGAEAGLIVRRTVAVQDRRVSIGTEQSGDELADDRHRTRRIEDERRPRRRLFDLATGRYAVDRQVSGGHVPGKGDRPFAIIVTRAFGPLPGQQFDVVQQDAAVDRLADVHSTLTGDADRTVADQMTEHPCEGERPATCDRRGEV